MIFDSYKTKSNVSICFRLNISKPIKGPLSRFENLDRKKQDILFKYLLRFSHEISYSAIDFCDLLRKREGLNRSIALSNVK